MNRPQPQPQSGYPQYASQISPQYAQPNYAYPASVSGGSYLKSPLAIKIINAQLCYVNMVDKLWYLWSIQIIYTRKA